MSYSEKKYPGHSDFSGGPVVGTCLNSPPVRPPSLEERLDFLQRGVERVSALRSRLGSIADRLQADGSGGASGPCSPPAADLSGRFAEVINYLHTNVEELERLAYRIENALFEDKPCATEAVRR